MSEDLRKLVAKGEFLRELSLSDKTDVISSLTYETEAFQVVLSFRPVKASLTAEGFFLYCSENEKVTTDSVEIMAQKIAIDLFKMIKPDFIQVQIIRSFNEATSLQAVAQMENKGK